MSLGTRIWVTVASLIVLAVVGEFVGAARRRILRREVPDARPPELKPGQFLVRVKGPDGRPVPQARISVLSHSGPPGGRRGARRFGGMSSGLAVLGPREDPGEETWLEVWGPADTADEPLPFGALLTGPIPASSESLEVVLPPERSLAGSIRLEGRPLPGVKVFARLAYPEAFEFLAGSGGDYWQGDAYTGPDGRFLVGRLGEGAQDVAFEAPPGTAIAARRFDGGGTLDIDLDGRRAVAVTVVDGGGRPVANAGIAVEEPSPIAPKFRRTRARGRSDGAGVVRLHGLDPSVKYRLVATRPGAGQGVPAEELDWTPSDATVTFRPLRSVWARVVDEYGTPHVGAAVTAAPADPARRKVSGATDGNGRCTLNNIDAGPATVTVTDMCRFRPADAVATREVGADEKEVLFTLPRGAGLSVLLAAGWDPRNPPRAFLREEGGGAATSANVQWGPTAWHSLDPAKTYAVLVRDAAGNRSVRADGLVPGTPATPVSLRLAPGRDIRVAVRWPEGAKDAGVAATWGAMDAVTGSLQDDGSWLLRALPPGKYVVRARCTVPGRADAAQASVEAEAGGEASIRVE